MKKLLLSLLLAGFSLISFAQTPEEQQAIALFKSGKNTEAIAAFQQIFAKNPTNVNAINALGQLYLRNNKYKEAYDIASKGLLINKTDDNLSIIKARAASYLGKTDEAIVLMDACIGRDAGFFMPYYVKGMALDAQDKIQLAIGMYSKAIQLNPDFSEAYLNRGNDFVSISRYQQAIADYDKVLFAAPESNEAYNMRGMAYYRLEKIDNALANYTKAITYGNFNALTNRGVIYIEQGKNELAKADFVKAISIKPNQADDAYFNLADVLNKEQQYNDALINIEKAVTLAPKSTLYQSMYANTLLNLKKDNEGLAAAERVLMIDAKNRDGFIYKATALNNLKRYDEAVKTISQGINEYPDFHLMYALRGFFYKQMGKTELAEADNAKAKQLGTKN